MTVQEQFGKRVSNVVFMGMVRGGWVGATCQPSCRLVMWDGAGYGSPGFVAARLCCCHAGLSLNPMLRLDQARWA